MESRKEKHNKRVFKFFYQASLPISDSYLSFSQNKAKLHLLNIFVAT